MITKQQYWDEIAAVYQLSGSEWLWRIHSDAVNKRYFNAGVSGRRFEFLLKTDLFDEAFGDGLLAFSKKHARCIIGVDLSESVLRKARSRHPGLAAVGSDVRHLPFEDKRFDIVLSNSTLDHFVGPGDIQTGLGEIYRVLRPSGRLLLTLDNPVNPLVAMRQALPFRLLHKLGIVPYFTGATLAPSRLRNALENTGFEVCRMESILHCPRFAAVLLCRAATKYAGVSLRSRLLDLLMAFERLSRLPTRYVTGYFIFAVSIRR